MEEFKEEAAPQQGGEVKRRASSQRPSLHASIAAKSTSDGSLGRSMKHGVTLDSIDQCRLHEGSLFLMATSEDRRLVLIDLGSQQTTGSESEFSLS